MKRYLILFLLIFSLTISTLEANNFVFEGKLSQKVQLSYKQKIDVVFEALLEKSAHQNVTDSLNTIKNRIENIQNGKRLSETNRFILNYLLYLIDNKIVELQFDNLIDISDSSDESLNTSTLSGAVVVQDSNTQNTPPQNIGNQVITRKCYIENGEGQQTYIQNTWSTCEVVSCNLSYHKEGNICVSNEQKCEINNGIGTKFWNGSWSSCTVNTCQSGFESKEGKCLQVCSTGTHREGEVCVNNIVSCEVENGKGQKEWKNGSYGTCKITSCNLGYDILNINNKCEKVILGAKLLNKKQILSGENNLLATLSIETNVTHGKVDEICFIDKNNTTLSSSIYFESNKSGQSVNSNFRNNQLCFYPYFTILGGDYSIKIGNKINDTDIGKEPFLQLIKNEFEFEHNLSGNTYYIDNMNYIEE